MSNYLIVHAQRKHSKNKFEDYCLTGLRAKDMYLSKDGKVKTLELSDDLKTHNLQEIICNPNTASVQTAKILSNNLKIPSSNKNYLLSVKYDFSQFTNYKLWEKLSPNKEEMVSLRSKSLEFFLEDKLLEPKSEIIQRFKKLEEKLQNSDNLLVISQAYYLKLFYLYLNTRFEASFENMKNLMNVDDYLYQPLGGYLYPNLTKFKI